MKTKKHRIATLLLLPLALLLAACAASQGGDPLVAAWEALPPQEISEADIEAFRAAARAVRQSEEFRIKAMDSPEFAALLARLSEAEDADTVQGLMPRYVRINAELNDASWRVVSLVMVLLSLFLLASTVFFVLYIRQTRAVHRLRAKMQMEQAVSTATIAMQEEERDRIYKELHDTIAQDSRSALFSVRELKSRLANDDEATALLRHVEAMETNNINNVRSIIRNIIPPDVMRGFTATLQEWADIFSAQRGIRCTLCIRPDVPLESLAQTQRLHLFRIMQEALVNVQMHSGSEECAVLIRTSTDRRGREAIAMTISDDGEGFDLDDAARVEGHFGLRGMRNRVAVLDGEFRITTSPGGGTQVFAEIPLHLNGGGVDATSV